jgi:hypothetical protein
VVRVVGEERGRRSGSRASVVDTDVVAARMSVVDAVDTGAG